MTSREHGPLLESAGARAWEAEAGGRATTVRCHASTETDASRINLMGPAAQAGRQAGGTWCTLSRHHVITLLSLAVDAWSGHQSEHNPPCIHRKHVRVLFPVGTCYAIKDQVNSLATGCCFHIVGLQNAMMSSRERTSAEAEGYRIERTLMDCVAPRQLRGRDTLHQ